MSTNRRKLKRNIRPPKRYEDYVPTVSKRNETKVESSSDEISKVDCMNKEASSSIEVTIGGNDVKRDFVISVEERKGRNKDMGNENGDKNDGKNKSYANMVKSNEMLVNKKLMFITPKTTEDGMVKVLFNEEIVSKGCAKWQFTICGQFIGQDMNYFELRYHAKRMWRRFDLTEVIVNKSGVNLFKFKDEKGINCVMEQGPYMIRTWSVKGISALASSLGKPLIMDEMTANICQYGVGRTNFARVLVDIRANKKLGDKIEIEYIGKNESVKGTKETKVMYDWKPDACPHCCESDRLKEQEEQGENVENMNGIGQTMT
nr:hypothetical protein [Tanacetum cinerariifolium]